MMLSLIHILIEQTWMQLPECCEMNVMLQSLDRIQKLRPYFDYILCGHSHGLEDASLCEAQRQAVWEICNGQVQNDEPYVYYGGTCRAHQMCIRDRAYPCRTAGVRDGPVPL